MKGNITTKKILSIGGKVDTNYAVSAIGLSSLSDKSQLSYKTLAISKEGFKGTCSLTLKVVDKNGNAINFPANNNKSIAAKTFKGNFDDKLLLISEDNCSDAKLKLNKNKLYIVTV